MAPKKPTKFFTRRLIKALLKVSNLNTNYEARLQRQVKHDNMHKPGELLKKAHEGKFPRKAMSAAKAMLAGKKIGQPGKPMFKNKPKEGSKAEEALDKKGMKKHAKKSKHSAAYPFMDKKKAHKHSAACKHVAKGKKDKDEGIMMKKKSKKLDEKAGAPDLVQKKKAKKLTSGEHDTSGVSIKGISRSKKHPKK